MSINQRYTVSILVNATEILVEGLSMQHSISSPLPSANVTVSHADYVFTAAYGAGFTAIPPADIIVTIDGVISYTYHGVITGINGAENELSLSNTLTIMPSSYFATILTTSISAVGVTAYLSDPIALMRYIITYFNANVFPALGGTLTAPLVLSAPICSYPMSLLTVAPRFLGMSCYDMLSQIAGSYGLSVYFTWDNQVMIGSIVNPVSSNIIISRDMTGSNSFALDMPMAVYSAQGWNL